MADFEIETGVPLPARSSVGGAGAKYPWSNLEVGQSFFVSDAPKHFSSMVAHASTAYSPRKFSQRKMDGGIRVWRIA